LFDGVSTIDYINRIIYLKIAGSARDF